MINDEKKVSDFIKAINAEADAKCEEIKNETDSYIERELKTAKKAAKANAKTVAASELSKLGEQSNADSYKSRVCQIKEIVAKRAEITDKVFAKATKEIIEFTQSGEYGDFLEKSAKNILSAIGDDAVIYVKEDDDKYSSRLKAFCKDVKTDKSIIIGGCKGENTSASMSADDTLDSRIKEQREEFYSYSGLSITG